MHTACVSADRLPSTSPWRPGHSNSSWRATRPARTLPGRSPFTLTSAGRRPRTRLGGHTPGHTLTVAAASPVVPSAHRGGPAALTLRLAGRSPGLASTGRPGLRTRAGHPERPIKGVRRNVLQNREDVPPTHPLPHPGRLVTCTGHHGPQPTAHTGSPQVRIGSAQTTRTRSVHRRNTAARPPPHRPNRAASTDILGSAFVAAT